MALNLTTRAEYKTHAGINSTTYDAEIDALIPRVSDFVKNYCRRSFVDYYTTQAPKIEYFNGGIDRFILKEPPVNTVISVQTSDDYGQTYTNLTQYTDWVQEGDCIVSLDKYWGLFKQKIRGYKITYTAGYDDVPFDLELAVMDLISYYRKNDGAVHVNRDITPNVTQVQYVQSTSLPAHIRRVLDQYVADYT